MPLRVKTPPLPPDWIREEDPTVPEQIPGSGTPIIPPEADPFTGQPVATPLSASYKDQIEQMVSKLANRTGKFVTGGGEPKMAGSVMGETGDRLANVVAGYLKMFAPDPTIVTPGAGTIVPRLGRAGFTKAELAVQKDLAANPKLSKTLEALKRDKRPGGTYTLSYQDLPGGQRGYTEFTADRASGKQKGPIDIYMDPKKMGFETPIHEADHAFAYRRAGASGTGNQPNLDYFNSLPAEIKKKYLNAAAGSVTHAATYARADAAAHRLGLASHPHGSIY